ncbi:MAG: MFS transporter [Pseudonocardia sp.]
MVSAPTVFGAVRRVSAAPTHQPEQSRALSWGQRRFLLVLGLPAFGVALAYTVVSTYLPVLLDRLSGPTVTGILLGVEGLIGLVLPILVGGWSDRLRTRIGGRLPFILAGAVFTIPALVLMPLFAGSLAGVAVTLALFLIGYFVYFAPYYALYPDLVPDEIRGRSQGFQGGLRQGD